MGHLLLAYFSRLPSLGNKNEKINTYYFFSCQGQENIKINKVKG